MACSILLYNSGKNNERQIFVSLELRVGWILCLLQLMYDQSYDDKCNQQYTIHYMYISLLIVICHFGSRHMKELIELDRHHLGKTPVYKVLMKFYQHLYSLHINFTIDFGEAPCWTR